MILVVPFALCPPPPGTLEDDTGHVGSPVFMLQNPLRGSLSRWLCAFTWHSGSAAPPATGASAGDAAKDKQQKQKQGDVDGEGEGKALEDKTNAEIFDEARQCVHHCLGGAVRPASAVDPAMNCAVVLRHAEGKAVVLLPVEYVRADVLNLEPASRVHRSLGASGAAAGAAVDAGGADAGKGGKSAGAAEDAWGEANRGHPRVLVWVSPERIAVRGVSRLHPGLCVRGISGSLRDASRRLVAIARAAAKGGADAPAVSGPGASSVIYGGAGVAAEEGADAGPADAAGPGPADAATGCVASLLRAPLFPGRERRILPHEASGATLRRFAVIDTEPAEQWKGHAQNLVAASLRRPGDTWKVYQAFAGELPPLDGPERPEAVVITGSDLSANDAESVPWMRDLFAFVRAARDAGAPRVLGICFGSQAIARALGGEVAAVDPAAAQLPEDGPGFILGREEVHFDRGACVRAAQTIFPRSAGLIETHGEEVSVLPPGATALASSGTCRHEAFAAGPTVVGVQFHAEFSARAVDRNILTPLEKEGKAQPGWASGCRDSLSRAAPGPVLTSLSTFLRGGDALDPLAVRRRVREGAWSVLRAAGQTPPTRAQGRVPVFAGAREAAINLSRTPPFIVARAVHVSGSVSLTETRFACLAAGKALTVAHPRLSSRDVLLHALHTGSIAVGDVGPVLSSRVAMSERGTPVPVARAPPCPDGSAAEGAQGGSAGSSGGDAADGDGAVRADGAADGAAGSGSGSGSGSGGGAAAGGEGGGDASSEEGKKQPKGGKKKKGKKTAAGDAGKEGDGGGDHGDAGGGGGAADGGAVGGKIDLYIASTVAVCARTGARLGRGGGLSDLEWGALAELGYVDKSTIVACVVHDDQVIDDFPSGCAAPWDVPADIVATPSRVLFIPRDRRAPRPEGILWECLEADPKMSALPAIVRIRKIVGGSARQQSNRKKGKGGSAAAKEPRVEERD